MRISISGTANQGKTTLISDFIKEWPNYKSSEFDYRTLIKDNKLSCNKDCNQEGQWAILNGMIDEMQKYSSTDNVIFDRCPLDCLIYSFWSLGKGKSDIDSKFISKILPLVRESMSHLDIMFFVPKSKFSPIPIIADDLRETDPEFIDEIDNLFKAMIYQYHTNFDRTEFFPKEECPAVIDIFGNREERIHLIRQYLNVDGQIIGEEGDTILNPNNINELESLIKSQSDQLSKDKFEQKQIQMLKEFVATGK